MSTSAARSISQWQCMECKSTSIKQGAYELTCKNCGSTDVDLYVPQTANKLGKVPGSCVARRCPDNSKATVSLRLTHPHGLTVAAGLNPAPLCANCAVRLMQHAQMRGWQMTQSAIA